MKSVHEGFVKDICHCVKSVEIPSFFWSVFSCIQTKYGDSLGKYGPEKTPHLDTFHTVCKTEASDTNNQSLIKRLRRRFCDILDGFSSQEASCLMYEWVVNIRLSFYNWMLSLLYEGVVVGDGGLILISNYIIIESFSTLNITLIKK